MSAGLGSPQALLTNDTMECVACSFQYPSAVLSKGKNCLKYNFCDTMECAACSFQYPSAILSKGKNCLKYNLPKVRAV